MKEADDVMSTGHTADSTPDEPWTVERPPAHWYNAQSDYAIESLGDGNGKSVLVIGSPLFEALELKQKGWNVTYVDVRQPPPVLLDHLIIGDAAADDTDLGVARYDAATSTCVLCHAGLGRYGDAVDERADYTIVDKLFTALRPGAICVLTLGPVFHLDRTVRMSRIQRVYCLPDAFHMTRMFNMVEYKIFNVRLHEWVPEINHDRCLDADYLTMKLTKP